MNVQTVHVMRVHNAQIMRDLLTANVILGLMETDSFVKVSAGNMDSGEPVLFTISGE